MLIAVRRNCIQNQQINNSKLISQHLVTILKRHLVFVSNFIVSQQANWVKFNGHTYGVVSSDCRIAHRVSKSAVMMIFSQRL